MKAMEMVPTAALMVTATMTVVRASPLLVSSLVCHHHPPSLFTHFVQRWHSVECVRSASPLSHSPTCGALSEPRLLERAASVCLLCEPARWLVRSSCWLLQLTGGGNRPANAFATPLSHQISAAVCDPAAVQQFNHFTEAAAQLVIRLSQPVNSDLNVTLLKSQCKIRMTGRCVEG